MSKFIINDKEKNKLNYNQEFTKKFSYKNRSQMRKIHEITLNEMCLIFLFNNFLQFLIIAENNTGEHSEKFGHPFLQFNVSQN